PKAEALGFVAPEPAPFVWPTPITPPRPRFTPALDLPASLGLIDERSFQADLVRDLYRRAEPDPLADVMDGVLKAPELLIDTFFTCARGERRPIRAWDEDEGRSVTAQMLDFDRSSRQERIGIEFLHQLGDREMKYFANFGDSRANTFAFQNGTQDADLHDL